MLALKVKDSVQKGNQHLLFVLVAEDFGESNIVFNVCEFHIKQFGVKIQKTPGFAVVFVVEYAIKFPTIYDIRSEVGTSV